MAPRITRRGPAAATATPSASTEPRRRAQTVTTATRELGSEELKALRASVTKRYGAQLIKSGSSVEWVRRIPTGVFTFDYATLGGWPQSRIHMIHGKKHSGKTTIALRSLASAQTSLPDKQPVLADVEGTYDAVWGEKQGIDNGGLICIQPEYGEQAADLVVGLVETDDVSLIALDSIAAMIPIKEAEASAEDSLVGAQARMVTSMLRKINGAIIKERRRGHMVTLLLVNQQRSNIGGFKPNPNVEPITLPGGKAISYFTSVEVKVTNKETASKDDNGFDTLAFNEHAFTIEKNKCNGGMRKGEFRMLRRDDPERGLLEGEMDDAETMLAFCKRLGWYNGGGRNWNLNFGDYRMAFANIDEAVRRLYEDRAIHWALRCHLIADAAAQQKQHTDFVQYILSGSAQ